MTTTFQLPALEVMTSSLQSTKRDIETLIASTRESLKSPMLDYRDRDRMKRWLQELAEQLAEINTQLGI